MKKIFYLAYLPAVFFASCNSSSNPGADNKKEEDKKETAPSSAADNVITFKVNGELVKSSGWNISYMNLMKNVPGVNVTSDMHKEKRTINININGTSAGTYPFQKGMKALSAKGAAYGGYRPDYMKDMLNSFDFINGNFIITAIDSTAGLLNATFSGKAVNQKGEAVEITEGKVINGKLKPAAKISVN